MNHRQTHEFLLCDWLQVESLNVRPCFAEHTRVTFLGIVALIAQPASLRAYRSSTGATNSQPSLVGT
jgi:hypothetical protein